jgi:hypothetical protein
MLACIGMTQLRHHIDQHEPREDRSTPLLPREYHTRLFSE